MKRMENIDETPHYGLGQAKTVSQIYDIGQAEHSDPVYDIGQAEHSDPVYDIGQAKSSTPIYNLGQASPSPEIIKSKSKLILVKLTPENANKYIGNSILFKSHIILKTSSAATLETP